MGQITLNKADAQRVLANPDSTPSARVISALAVAYLEIVEHADDADLDSLAISKKLAHMCAREIYDASDDRRQQEGDE